MNQSEIALMVSKQPVRNIASVESCHRECVVESIGGIRQSSTQVNNVE